MGRGIYKHDDNSDDDDDDDDDGDDDDTCMERCISPSAGSLSAIRMMMIIMTRVR